MSQSHLDVRAYPRTIGFGGGKMHLLGLGIYPTSSAMDCWSWVFLLGICLKQQTTLTACPFTRGSLLLTKQAAKKQNCLQACDVFNRPWLPHSKGLKRTLPRHPTPLLGKRGKVQSQSESCSVVSDSLQPHGLYSPWNSPGQNTGVGSLSLLQGIFPTQGLNPGLPHCRQILYQLSHKGSPRILEWVAHPFSRRSSWPRNRTRVSCITGGFFTNWAMREAQARKASQGLRWGQVSELLQFLGICLRWMQNWKAPGQYSVIQDSAQSAHQCVCDQWDWWPPVAAPARLIGATGRQGRLACTVHRNIAHNFLVLCPRVIEPSWLQKQKWWSIPGI